MTTATTTTRTESKRKIQSPKRTPNMETTTQTRYQISDNDQRSVYAWNCVIEYLELKRFSVADLHATETDELARLVHDHIGDDPARELPYIWLIQREIQRLKTDTQDELTLETA